MAIKGFVTKEEYAALPKDMQSAYVVEGDRYRVDVQADAGYAFENVGALRTALETERHGRSTESGELAGWKALGLSTAEAKKAIARSKEMDKWTPEEKVREQMESFREQLTAAHGAEKAAIQVKLDKLTTQLKRELREGSLAKAIGEKGNQKMLIPAMRDRIDVMEDERTGELVTRVLGADGKTPRLSVKNPGQYMGADELVEEFRADKEWAPAFNGHGAQGTGTTGSRGGPGSAPGGVQLTEAQVKGTRPLPASVMEAMGKGAMTGDIPVV